MAMATHAPTRAKMPIVRRRTIASATVSGSTAISPVKSLAYVTVPVKACRTMVSAVLTPAKTVIADLTIPAIAVVFGNTVSFRVGRGGWSVVPQSSTAWVAQALLNGAGTDA